MEFWRPQMDFVFFVYGAGFLLLAVTCGAMRNTSDRRRMWTCLGLFGALHGLNEWLDMLATSVGDSNVFKAVRIIVMAASFVFLLECGRVGSASRERKWLSPWLTALLVASAALCGIKGWGGLNAGCRYFLGFPGGVLTALAFFRLGRSGVPTMLQSTCLTLTAIFLAYGVGAGLVVPKAPILAASHFNQDWFIHMFSFPIQVLRGGLACGAAVFVWILYRQFTRARDLLLAGAVATALIAVIAGGWLFAQNRGEAACRQVLRSTLIQAKASAANLPVESLRDMASKDVVNQPRYRALRALLSRLREANPECSLVYTIELHHGSLVFAADSAPLGSAIHSKPGDVFTGAPSELMDVFLRSKDGSAEDYSDPWGSWTSAYVPLRDPQTGQVISVLAVNVPQSHCNHLVAAARLEGIVVTLLLVALICGFYLAYERQMYLKSLAVLEREQLSVTLRSIGDGVVATDNAGRVALVNAVACAIIGRRESDIIGLPVDEVLDIRNELTGDKSSNPILEVLATGRPTELGEHASLATRKGTLTPIADSCAPIRDSKGDLVGAVLVFRDVTASRAAEAELIRANSELYDERSNLHAIFNAAQVGLIVADDNARVTRINEAGARMVSREAAEFIGRRPGDGLCCENAQTAPDGCGSGDECGACPVREAVLGVLETNSLVKDVEASRRLVINGKPRTFYLSLNAAPLESDGRRQVLIAISDITERKQAEVALDHQAHHDALTGLPNRLEFKEKLCALATAAGRRRKTKLVLMFVDLDKFKLINDTLGHETGDKLLIQVGERLRGCLRDSDVLARMGGDEFTALLPGMLDPNEADVVAARMLSSLAAPFEIGFHRLTIGASIGMSVFPDDAVDAETLIKNADVAMYAAKESGRNRFEWYTGKITVKATGRMEIERELRLAVQNGDLEVHYQPIVEVTTGNVVGAEALLRWNHAEKGLISPGVFVPVAEETGLIVPIGEFVLREACTTARKWHGTGYPDLEIAVNVSPAQFYDSGWIDRLNDIVAETGLDRNKLNLEITETMLADNEERELQILSELRSSGLRMSIDDFGIGYSSLARLRRFPIIHMKVDGTFIKDIASSPEDRAMTHSIIGMAHGLGVKVTAEWVENEDQLDVIRSLGCDYAQGFLISPPVRAEEFELFLANNIPNTRRAA